MDVLIKYHDVLVYVEKENEIGYKQSLLFYLKGKPFFSHPASPSGKNSAKKIRTDHLFLNFTSFLISFFSVARLRNLFAPHTNAF